MKNKITIPVLLLFASICLHAQEMHDVSFRAHQNQWFYVLCPGIIPGPKFNSIQFGSGAVYRFGPNYLDNGIVRDEYPQTRNVVESESYNAEPIVLCCGIRASSNFGYVQFGSGRVYYFNLPLYIDQAYYSR